MSELKELIRQLKELQVNNARAERALIDEIERIQQNDTKLTSKETTVKDRDGKTLQVGDQVELLTSGISRSKEGTVTKIHKKQASIRTKGGTHVKRAFHNLRVTTRAQRDQL